MVSNKLNLFVHLNAYRDSNPSNNPSLSHAKWTRDVQGISTGKASSEDFCLAPGESRTVFNGSRTISHDNTTQYDLSLKSGSSSIYVLKHVGGTAPDFRPLRSSGADATTEATLTISGSVMTLASTGGTPFNFLIGGVIAGDTVSLGDAFSLSNQGKYKILSVTATSVSFENNGAAEGPITLGANFDEQVHIYGAAGVQKGDKIRIFGGFSPASLDTYEIVDVRDDLVEFFSSKSLPEELAVTTDLFNIYSSAKKMIYLETDKKIDVSVNGTIEAPIEPFIETDGIKPGIMLRCAVIWSLVLTNNGSDIASLYVASVE